jgi:hypothetical protein
VESLHTTAPYSFGYKNVHLCKPAHTREGAITEKTGGSNCDIGVLERMHTYAPKGKAGVQRVTSGVDLNTKPTY